MTDPKTLKEAEMIQKAVDAIGYVALAGSLHECPHCRRALGYLYDVSQVRTILYKLLGAIGGI